MKIRLFTILTIIFTASFVLFAQSKSSKDVDNILIHALLAEQRYTQLENMLDGLDFQTKQNDVTTQLLFTFGFGLKNFRVADIYLSFTRPEATESIVPIVFNFCDSLTEDDVDYYNRLLNHQSLQGALSNETVINCLREAFSVGNLLAVKLINKNTADTPLRHVTRKLVVEEIQKGMTSLQNMEESLIKFVNFE